MSEEYEDQALRDRFVAAEQLHANFYHGFLEDYQIDDSRELVRDFVARVLALLG
jgi:hypothetical protein